jgi:hypothetical protein
MNVLPGAKQVNESSLARAWRGGLFTLLLVYVVAIVLLCCSVREIRTLLSLTAFTASGIVASQSLNVTMVHFNTNKYHSVTFESSDPFYQAGDTVLVRYNPHDPQKARIDDPMDLGFVLLFFLACCFGFFFIAIGSTCGYIIQSRSAKEIRFDD